MIVEFTEDGVIFKKEVTRPVSGDTKEIEVDYLDYNQLPEKVDFNLTQLDVDQSGRAKLIVDEEASISESEVNHFWEQVEQKLQIKKDGDKIVLNERKTAAENFADFVGYLVRNNYLTDDDLPYQKPGARSRYLVNTEPKHKDGTEMISPREISGFYVETNYSEENIKENILHLGEEFGSNSN